MNKKFTKYIFSYLIFHVIVTILLTPRPTTIQHGLIFQTKCAIIHQKLRQRIMGLDSSLILFLDSSSYDSYLMWQFNQAEIFLLLFFLYSGEKYGSILLINNNSLENLQANVSSKLCFLFLRKSSLISRIPMIYELSWFCFVSFIFSKAEKKKRAFCKHVYKKSHGSYIRLTCHDNLSTYSNYFT